MADWFDREFCRSVQYVRVSVPFCDRLNREKDSRDIK